MNTYLVKSISLRLLNDEINKIINSSNNIIRLNMEECSIDDIISECNYYSLLDEPKYVVVTNFKVNKDSAELCNYVNNDNENTKLILIADKVDKRSALYKLLNKNNKVTIIDEIKNTNSKINQYAKKLGLSIEHDAILKLLENNLNNYDLVLNEIDKISIITTNITYKDADKYSVKINSEENFEFSDAVIRKDYKAIKIYLDEFVELKQEVSPFIGLLAGQYRLMYATKQLSGTDEEIANILSPGYLKSIHPYRIKLAKEKSCLYTQEELQKRLLDLCDLDYNLKTTTTDKYILLKVFLINI